MTDVTSEPKDRIWHVIGSHSFVQQLFIEGLLCARHYSRKGKSIIEQNI